MGQHDVLRALDEVAGALQSLHIQLRVHRNMLSFWGYSRLSHEYGRAQVDLGGGLDAVIAHALSLERQVDLTPTLKLNIGQTVEEVLVSDRAVALAVLRLTTEGPSREGLTFGPGIQDKLFCVSNWLAFLDQQLELVRQMGLSSYLVLVAQPVYRPSVT